MAVLKYLYRMRLLFDSPVTGHRFTIRCFPHSDDCQEVLREQICISPNRFLSEDIDSYGNRCIYGYCEEEHSVFSIETEGLIRTGKNDGVRQTDICRSGFYKYPTPCTEAGPAVRSLRDTAKPEECADDREKVWRLADTLYRQFTYRQGVTVIGTTAEEAMKNGAGVCQDYAHILLALCRMERIPCRYAAGILVGEGCSHAWVEVFLDGFWYGIDPTNHSWVSDQHIKFSNGRDYRDCMINQGLFTGTARQTQEIFASAEEITEETKW